MDDWMISKKRYWGLALPIYECCECGHVRRHRQRGRAARARASRAGTSSTGHSPHRPWIDAVEDRAARSAARRSSRIPDVGNPWLDAGIVPYSTLDYRHDRDVLGASGSPPT